MKHVKLVRISIRNFKGITYLAILFARITHIFGKNASGKTTVMDAFLWLLFGKDSSGRSDFQIRPLDNHGDMIDNIDIEVEAVLDVDGTEICLKKTQKQNWVKKRGSDTSVFQGNTNNYEVDGFPTSQKEFDAKVAGILEEGLFKILTNPKAFAALKWQEQRAILLKFVAEITDADILALDEARYAPIKADVMAAGAEKAKEKAAMTLRKLREEQKGYPIRIDEATKGIVPGLDAESIARDRETINAKMEAVHNARISLSEELRSVADIQQQIMSAKLEMGKIATAENAKVQAARYSSQKACDDAMAEVRALTARYNRTVDALKIVKDVLAEDERTMEDARARYRAIKTRTLPDDMKVCPTCGKPFDEDRLGVVVSDFEARKVRDLERIDETGRKLRAQIDSNKENVARMETEIQALKAECDAKLEHADALKAMAEAVPDNTDLTTIPEYVKLQKLISDCEAKLATMDTGGGRKLELDSRERDLREELAGIEFAAATLSANARAQDRIRELREEQLDCSQKVADQEEILCLLDEFVKAKMNMLSEKINSKFKLVRWRLFDEQINKAIKDTCVMQIASNGSFVDYPDANTAAQVQGGIDVIRALSELYGVTAPIFIDNRESIIEIPETDAQVINLVVSADDDVLRVEGDE